MTFEIRAVLFDRDGTLIRNVPYNGDPDLVVPMPGASECVQALRASGIRLGVVTNQSAVGRGLISHADVEMVNQRVEEVVGSFDTWQICPHAPNARCVCRKPQPGMVLSAAAALGVQPEQCLVVGDSITDLQAAELAGAQGVLLTSSAPGERQGHTIDRLLDLVPWVETSGQPVEHR